MDEQLRIKLVANTKDAEKALKEAKKKIQELEEAAGEASQQTTSLTDTLTNQAKELKALKEKYIDVASAQGVESDAAKDVAAQIEALSKEYLDNKDEAMRLAQAADSLDAGFQKAQAEAKRLAEEAERLAEEEKAAAAEAERLAKANRGLTEVVSDQADELSALKTQYVDIAKAKGKDSDEAKALAAQIQQLSREYDDNAREAKALADAADELDVGMQRAKAEAKALAEEEKRASEETERLAKEQQELDDALEATKNGFSQATTVVAGAVTAISAALVGLAEGTRDYRNEQEKLNTAFQMAGASSEVAYNTYYELVGILGESDRAVEAANHLAKLTKNEEDLAKWTDIAAGVYATFGDSLPIEGLTEAANETAKTGTVTGVLADALNWAGKSEDAFNAQLEKCTTEQQRQALITNTLNGLYKTTADRFKVANKEVIEANKANEKLKKQMAELGKKVEPVITEFKLFGAALLEDLEEPIEDLCDFLLNDFIPTLKDVGEWISENSELITFLGGLVLGGVAAYNAYTAATKIAAAAQAVLNAVMNANPIGLIITALGVAVGGLAAFALTSGDTTDSLEEMGLASGNATEDVDGLTQAEKDLKAATDEATQAHKNQQESFYKDNEVIVSEMGYIQELSEELRSLADAKGRVKESDEARAKFILGELNEALGTEYTMVDGVIQKYGTLKGTIDEVILKKTAMSLLEANNERYIEAIQNENELYNNMIKTYDDYNNAVAEKQALADEISEKQKKLSAEYHDMSELERRDLRLEIEGLVENLFAYDETIAEKKQLWEDASSSYSENQKIINDHMAAEEAALSGNTQTVIDLLTDKKNEYDDYSANVDDNEAKILNTLRRKAVEKGLEAENTRENFEKGVKGYTEEMVKEAEDGYKAALEEFETAYADAEGVGEDVGDGLKDGMEDKRSSILAKARSLVKGLIDAMKKEADSHSPSKKTMALGLDMGEGTEIGLEKSASNVEEAAQGMIKDAIDGIQEMKNTLVQNDLSEIFDTSFFGKDTKITARTITSIESSSLGAAIDKLASNSNQPIVLKVGEKVFGEICLDSFNGIIAQTGNIPLNVPITILR